MLTLQTKTVMTMMRNPTKVERRICTHEEAIE